MTTGKQARFKADVFQGAFRKIIIWDPVVDIPFNPCALTITDTTFVVPLE